MKGMLNIWEKNKQAAWEVYFKSIEWIANLKL